MNQKKMKNEYPTITLKIEDLICISILYILCPGQALLIRNSYGFIFMQKNRLLDVKIPILTYKNRPLLNEK